MQGFFIVGTTGFEPATTRPPDVCATGLRYVPIMGAGFYRSANVKANRRFTKQLPGHQLIGSEGIFGRKQFACGGICLIPG